MLCVTSAVAQEEPELPKGRLLYSNGSHDDDYVIRYKAGVATYRTNMRSLNILQAKKPALEAIYFYEPQIFTEAMNLYRAKNYSEAKVKFAECEVSFKPLDSLPDNYATLAGFYTMECSRRSGDLEALSAELEKYRKDGLTRETTICNWRFIHSGRLSDLKIGHASIGLLWGTLGRAVRCPRNCVCK